MARNLGPTSSVGLRTFVARYWGEIRPYRFQLLLASLALLATVVLRMIEPWPLKFLFDGLLHRSGRGTANFLSGLSLPQLIWFGAGATCAAIALRALSEYVGKCLLSNVSNRVVNAVRIKLFRRLLGQSLHFFHHSRGGDLVLRMMSDISMLRDVSTNAMVPLLVSALTFVSMWIVMFVIQWQLALAAFAVLPLFWLVCLKTTSRIRASSRQQREREAALASTVSESISSIKLVQAMSLEDRLTAIVESQGGVSSNQEIRSTKLSAALERSVDLFFALASGLVLLIGMRLVMNGQSSPGDLLVVLAYLKRAFSPIQDYAKYTSRIAKASAAAERIITLNDAPVTETDRPDAIEAPRLRGAIEFKDVRFTHPGRKQVLVNASFSVAPGEIVAIIGRSGAGKSTLADLLLRFISPQSGTVSIDGQNASTFTAASLRAQIDVVLQETILLDGTIRENLVLGRSVSDADLSDALRLAGAEEFIQLLPQGVMTEIGERGVMLSHGQRQRIALARAALRKSPILVLDEPTAALDPANRTAVGKAIAKLSPSRSTILITHDMELARFATRVLRLSHGRLVDVTHELAADEQLATME